jgi:hypothetical protein
LVANLRGSYQANARGSVTLQGTLMNHTETIESVNFLVNVSTLLHEQSSYPADLPFILGEGNSLSGQGAPGLSNTFGAALWVRFVSRTMVVEPY